MKNYRKILPIALIVLLVTSWYMMISTVAKTNNSYKNYIKEARKFAEQGITKYAIENYEAAISINSTPSVYNEVAQYYKEQKKNDEYLDWSERFLEEYPTEEMAYDCILDAYLLQKDYESCYDIIFTADRRNISTDYIKKTREKIKYFYKMDINTYDDVGVFSNNLCPIKSNDLWGFANRFGEQRIICKYLQVGSYTKSGVVSVVNADGDAYYIDNSGSKVMVSKDKYKSFGLLVDNILAAEKPNGKYVYLNNEFEKLFGEYDFASTMNYGIAAVKIGSHWKLIDDEGKEITKSDFLDIKLDEKQIAFRNDRAFVSASKGKYIMVDNKGNQVGKLEFEDAKPFASESYAAVKINGKWCFVDKKGKLVSKEKYDDARSYNNGLAAVCIDGKWGFVDEKEKIVIKPKFFDAKDFNEKGSCFVNTGNKWTLLKLYRLNREE